MKGIEIAEKFYEEYGRQMIHEKFPELECLVAIGFTGAGSECFGYDDEISRDHDFEPGFCIFLPGEDVIDSRTAFRLERAYAALPKEFCGVERLKINPVGGNRHGVIRTADFFTRLIGTPDGIHDNNQWFSVPSHYLAEATNGKIFRDDYGEFTAIRNSLIDMPEDVRFKKLASHLVLMGQSGLYNYHRCIAHGETAAAQLAMDEFVRHTLVTAFLINGRHMPFYKWSFRALQELELLSEIASSLEILLTTGNTTEMARDKTAIIDEVSSAIISALRVSGISDAKAGDLGSHAYAVNDRIKDASLRNAGILFAAE